MHDASSFDFTKFVPGFDFLKNMGGTGSTAAASASPGWVAPTLDPAEIDKRIQELKTVQFWLEQNAKAVGATIQALEVQRMTLATLQSMNVGLADMAEALKLKPESFGAGFAAAAQAADTDTAAHDVPASAPAQKPSRAKKRKTSARAKTSSGKARAAGAKAKAGAVDPHQWWGALTDQFQNIAGTALHEMTKHAASHPGAPAAHKAGQVDKAEKASDTASASPRRRPAGKTAAKSRSTTRRARG